jgi:hypothetical protein
MKHACEDQLSIQKKMSQHSDDSIPLSKTTSFVEGKIRGLSKFREFGLDTKIMDEEYTLEEAMERKEMVEEQLKVSGLDKEVTTPKLDQFFMQEGVLHKNVGAGEGGLKELSDEILNNFSFGSVKRLLKYRLAKDVVQLEGGEWVWQLKAACDQRCIPVGQEWD